jgi:hypothetical protein
MMKRRDFLQRTGLLAVGGTHAFATRAACAESASETGRSPGGAARRTRVLVTSAQSELACVIAGALGREYPLRLTAPVPAQTPHDFLKSTLDHTACTQQVVRGMDAIVHVAEPLPHAADTEAIDDRTRGTYNLLRAAAQAGVRPVVYLSSLAMMDGYDERFEVDEDWRPLPEPASGALSDYLGEFTCREFARNGDLDVVVLRLGNVVRAEALANQAGDPAWVDPRDAAQAVSRALAWLLAQESTAARHWSVFHIRSRSLSFRFPMEKARRILGYEPEFPEDLKAPEVES